MWLLEQLDPSAIRFRSVALLGEAILVHYEQCGLGHGECVRSGQFVRTIGVLAEFMLGTLRDSAVA